MPTEWFSPTTISQYAESDIHVPWQGIDTDPLDVNAVRTTKDLLHISNMLANDLRMKTNYLVVTGFNWWNLPDTISGIEVKIHIDRVGRITDDTIQLYNGAGFSDNKANKDLSHLKTYGGEADLWGLTSIEPNDLNDTFGLLLRYQSHPNWPHRSTPNMRYIQIRVW